MGRKERCPQCGSKKITITENMKKCEICKYAWAGKPTKKTSKKEKVRF
jgi:ribosomal protein L37AE/L43A